MRWIVVDGIDGSGKSTIAHWIADRYEGMGKVEVVHHPSERWYGRISRKALQSEGKAMHTVAAVFYIIDVLMSVGRIRKDRKEDKTLIFVRYLMGTAYLPESLMHAGYDFFCKMLPVPKAMLLVDIDPEVAMSRLSSRQDAHEMFEDADNLRKYRRKVLALTNDDWKVLDNSGSEESSRRQLDSIMADWEAKKLIDF
ncbi:MAG: putative thymidylate kinase [Methanomassiliicoccales archaeon PtaU1.Bin124]|nr:MAG: putative thymidylate kinase [Methanomassiliicoccales archaeon PtaU1.Bin124]